LVYRTLPSTGKVRRWYSTPVGLTSADAVEANGGRATTVIRMLTVTVTNRRAARVARNTRCCARGKIVVGNGIDSESRATPFEIVQSR
jgi:hypothetical protein